MKKSSRYPNPSLVTSQNSESVVTQYEGMLTFGAEPRKIPKIERYERKESDIQSFSYKSRLNLIKTLAKVRFSKYQTVRFVTLTYHGDWNTNQQLVANEFSRFRRDLLTFYPNCHWIWRVELQKRGAPHLHLIFVSQENNRHFELDKMKQNITAIWFRHKRCNCEHCEQYAVDVKRVTSNKAVASYVCKYTAKTVITNKTVWTKRHWGTTYNLDTSAVDVLKMTGLMACTFRRIARRLVKSQRTKLSKQFYYMKKYRCGSLIVPYGFVDQFLLYFYENFDKS